MKKLSYLFFIAMLGVNYPTSMLSKHTSKKKVKACNLLIGNDLSAQNLAVGGIIRACGNPIT